jgi:hypothetical protein
MIGVGRSVINFDRGNLYFAGARDRFSVHVAIFKKFFLFFPSNSFEQRIIPNDHKM